MGGRPAFPGPSVVSASGSLGEPPHPDQAGVRWHRRLRFTAPPHDGPTYALLDRWPTGSPLLNERLALAALVLAGLLVVLAACVAAATV
jgi:hypothetical protein